MHLPSCLLRGWEREASIEDACGYNNPARRNWKQNLGVFFFSSFHQSMLRFLTTITPQNLANSGKNGLSRVL